MSPSASPFARYRPFVAALVAVLALAGAYAFGHARAGAGSAAAAPVASATPVASSASAASNAGISVTGTGTVSGTPNVLQLSMSVDVTKPDVASALQAANGAAAAVQKALTDDGVATRDLQTSGLSIQPNYTTVANSTKLAGYQVSESLSVLLRNLATAGKQIDDAAVAGGNAIRVDGAALDVRDDSLVAQARQQAFADALAKAQAYAKAAGRSLGAVTAISESDGSNSQPVEPLAFAASAQAPMPIQAGSQDVTVDVDVTWALS